MEHEDGNVPTDRLIEILVGLATAKCKGRERLGCILRRQPNADRMVSVLIRLSAAQCGVSQQKFLSALVAALGERLP